MHNAQDAKSENGHREGTVVRSTGSWYEVQTDEGVISSKVRGKFRLADEDVTNPVAVGDRVTIRLNEDGTGLITKIHERRNRLSRRAAGHRTGREHILVANVDRAWVVQAVDRPRFHPRFIDRFLVMTGARTIPAGVIFNKIDLLCEDDQEAFEFCAGLYDAIGYPVLRTSATEGEGLDALRNAFGGETNVIAGPSGVGKSTLLNRLEPGLNLETSHVSERTRRGRHTTTRVTLHPLTGRGFVADTPGVGTFKLLDIASEDLSLYFVEFRPYEDACRFRRCTHDHEPGCAVQAAVAAGDIADVRYESYLDLLKALRVHEAEVGY